MTGALAIVAILFLASAACIVAGVQMLVGLAWALIVLGLLLFGVAVFLRSRLTTNG